MTPLASIVIVCWGKRALTERCLLSLEATLGDELGTRFEIVVVDNASPDDTLDLLRAWEARDRITLVALPENRDFSGGCNAGAAAARGEVLIFLNNDTVVEPGTLGPLAETVYEPGVGAAGLRMLYADGTIQHAGVILAANHNLGGLATPWHAFRFEDGDTPAARGIYELDCVTGACLAIPREVFEELDGFDEGYHNGCEDVDLCFRIRMSGRTIVYRGDLCFLHDEGQTRSGQDDWPNVKRMMGTWRHLMEPDDELAATAWDARVIADAGMRDDAESTIVLAGQPNGIGPAADEARALLLAFERAGAPAVCDDHGMRLVRARVGGATGEALRRAMRRKAPQRGTLIAVPAGPAMAERNKDAWMRVARAPFAVGEEALAITADAGGIPPAVDAPPEAGPGGEGILVTLPAHDVPRTRELLRALAGAAGERPVTLVPTAVTRGLDALVAELLPGATLHRAISDERDWMALAANADLAVCLDPDDRFERRALCAAAAGATPIVTDDDGPAVTVLGSLACALGAAGSLADAFAAVRAAGDRREETAATVRTACDPATVGLAILRRLSTATAPDREAMVA